MNSRPVPPGLWSAERLSSLRSLLEGDSLLTINGSCMEPLVTAGSQVAVRSARWYWPGDILVVHGHDGRLYAHRLIGVYRRRGEWRYLTQADVSKRPDASVARADVIGRLIVVMSIGQRCLALVRFWQFCTHRSGTTRWLNESIRRFFWSST